LSGAWTLTYSPTANASCHGTRNVAVPTVEITNEPLTRLSRLTFTRDGEAFDDDQRRFTWSAPNVYFGTRTFETRASAQIYLTVVDNRTITGQIVGSFTERRLPCSFTIDFTLTHGS